MISHWDEMTAFQDKMNGCSLAGAPIRARVMHATRMTNGLFMEVSELQDSFSWKNSRDVSRKEDDWVDRDNVTREIVDCLFFLHHVAECFGIGPHELDVTFTEVMVNNRRRHHDGDLTEPEAVEETSIMSELQQIKGLLNSIQEGNDNDRKKCEM